MIRGGPRGGPEVEPWLPPTQGGGILFPQSLCTSHGVCIFKIRCAYAAAACPGRNYAQAISAWALLHPAAPLSPFCRKCNLHVLIGAFEFQPRLQYALGTWRVPLGGSLLAAFEFWSHASDTGSRYQSCLDSLPMPSSIGPQHLSGLMSMLTMPSSAQLFAVLAFRGGKGHVCSTPLSISFPCEFGSCVLGGGIILLTTVRRISTW